METCLNYCQTEIAYFSSDERKWINRVHKLKEQYPDEVRIIAEPDNNDGCIYCELPAKWLKVNPPRKMDLTDEQRRDVAKRLSAHRLNSQVINGN